MKAKGFLLIMGIVIALASCDVDVEPTVTYKVVDTTNTPLYNARVITTPCMDGQPCDLERINQNFIKLGYTNSSGTITWSYPYSAIINVNAAWTDCDTANGEYCLYTGQTVARFETKRQKKDEANDYEVVIMVREDN